MARTPEEIAKIEAAFRTTTRDKTLPTDAPKSQLGMSTGVEGSSQAGPTRAAADRQAAGVEDVVAPQPRTLFNPNVGETIAQDIKARAADSAAADPEPSIPSNITGSIEEATPTQKFYNTPIGEIISGFKAGMTLTPDPAGRDLQTQSSLTSAGFLGGIITSLAGVSAIGNVATSLVTSLTTKAKITAKIVTPVAGEFYKAGSTGIAMNSATTTIIGTAAQGTVIGTALKTSSAIGLAVKIAGTILTLSLGGKVFGKFIGQEEASQTLNIAARDAIMNGDYESYLLAAGARDEVLKDDTFWDNLIDLIPFANVLTGLDKYRTSATTAAVVYDKIAADMKTQVETGETSADKWKRLNAEQAAQDKATTDYYNDQRKAMFDYEQAAKSAARKSKREDEIKARNADAKFWASERAKQRQYEAEDRQAVAEFWAAYRKQAYKLQQDSRPSKLNFGLL